MKNRDRESDTRALRLHCGCRPSGANIVICVANDLEKDFQSAHDHVIQVRQIHQIVEIFLADTSDIRLQPGGFASSSFGGKSKRERRTMDFWEGCCVDSFGKADVP